jgi:hypothetical protein
MPEGKSDAEMRLLLMQIAEVEKNSPPAYPNWKRGTLAGVTVLLLALLLGFLLTIAAPADWFKIAWKCAVILGTAVFFWGAFRPQR